MGKRGGILEFGKSESQSLVSEIGHVTGLLSCHATHAAHALQISLITGMYVH